MYFRDPMTFITAKNRPDPLWKKLVTPLNSEYNMNSTSDRYLITIEVHRERNVQLRSDVWLHMD